MIVKRSLTERTPLASPRHNTHFCVFFILKNNAITCVLFLFPFTHFIRVGTPSLFLINTFFLYPSLTLFTQTHLRNCFIKKQQYLLFLIFLYILFYTRTSKTTTTVFAYLCYIINFNKLYCCNSA